MDVNLILTVSGYLLFVIVGFLAAWYKSNKAISERVAALITEAEDDYKSISKAGGEKFNWVVDRLYELIPAPIKCFVSRPVIETVVQSTFNAVEGYAKLQLNKLTNKGSSENGGY